MGLLPILTPTSSSMTRPRDRLPALLDRPILRDRVNHMKTNIVNNSSACRTRGSRSKCERCSAVLHAIRSLRMPRGDGAQSQTVKAQLGLRELVLDGAFAPASASPRSSSSERLGVSRTPLRLALSTLAHEGLLEPLPGGGFVVRSFTRADVSDAIELRGVLEGTAARLAAERLESADELDPLVAAVGAPGRGPRGRRRQSRSSATSSSTTSTTTHSSRWPRARRSPARSRPTPPSRSPRREPCSARTLRSSAPARS